MGLAETESRMCSRLQKRESRGIGDRLLLSRDNRLKELYTSGTTLSEMINWTPLSNELRGKIRFGPPPP